MKKSVFSSIAILTLALVLLSCQKKQATGAGKKPGQKEETAALFAVHTSRSVKGQIKDYLLVSGDIIAGNTVDAYSEVAGKVSRLFVSVGDRVTKDAPIAEVDPSRPGMTFVPGLAKAPISGIVVALPAQLGMTISQAVPVARISRTDSLELRTYIAERFISRVKIGLDAEISLEAYPGQKYSAKVRELSPVIDPASRTMEVRLDINRPYENLKPGMFAKIKIITEEKEAVVKVPASAMVKRFGENYIFVVEPDPADAARTIARKRPVVPGILIDDKLEILSGLSANEEVVIRGQTLLEEGVAVNVVDRLPSLNVKE